MTDIVDLTGKVALFDGKSLDGWYADVPALDTEPDTPAMFVVENGVLVSTGESVGHLVTEKSYRNYRLEVDWRLTEAGGGGGIVIHISQLRMFRTQSKNVFPNGFDIKTRHGDAGDIYCILETIDPTDPARRPIEPGQKAGGQSGDARHIFKIVDAERPLGEWNKFVIEARDRALKIWLNGQLVNDCVNCTTDNGRIGLMATFHRAEFSRIDIMPLA